jgi:hypothetical protein
MYDSKHPFISLIVVDILTNSSRKVVYLIVLCGIAADECYFKTTVSADIWKLKFGM